MKADPVRAADAAQANELAKLSAIELLEGYRAGRFTPRDVIEDVIAALDATQSSCNVAVTPMFEQARAAADQASAAWKSGQPAGKLAGVPVSIKDLVFVAGVPALGGAPLNKDFVPAADGAAVTALKVAGAIITCKTTTCEAGYKLTADSPVSGITRNPWNRERTSGGSSGGAAAAVAAGMTPFEIGTDLSCSIRLPSHFCGIFGLKPTEHRVSVNGVVPAPQGGPRPVRIMSCVGPMARTADDLALILSVIAGPDLGDTDVDPVPLGDFAAVAAKGLRIAFAPTFGELPVSNAIRGALEAVAKKLESAGAIVEDAKLPAVDFIDDLQQAGSLIPKITSAFSPGPDNPKASLADYLTALDRRDRSIAAWETFFQQWDALLCPPAMTTAFPHTNPGTPLEVDGEERQYFSLAAHGTLFNYSGHPAIVVPSGEMDDSLPIGVQLVGKWWSEARLIGIAKTLTEMTGGFRRPPGV